MRRSPLSLACRYRRGGRHRCRQPRGTYCPLREPGPLGSTADSEPAEAKPSARGPGVAAQGSWFQMTSGSILERHARFSSARRHSVIAALVEAQEERNLEHSRGKLTTVRPCRKRTAL